MREYEAIFKRKSVRNFSDEDISQNTLNDIREKLESLTKLFTNTPFKIKLMEKKDVFSKFAPYYLVFYGEKTEKGLANCGYMLQQMDLYLSGLSIGTCWYGFGKTGLISSAKDGLSFLIMLAFGKTVDNVHRQSITEFKRKETSDIICGKDWEIFAEAVRLAPSAMNSQPWFFDSNKGYIKVYRENLGIVKKIALEKYNKIDIGIALYHLALALKEKGNSFQFVADENPIQRDGFLYVMSVKY